MQLPGLRRDTRYHSPATASMERSPTWADHWHFRPGTIIPGDCVLLPLSQGARHPAGPFTGQRWCAARPSARARKGAAPAPPQARLARFALPHRARPIKGLNTFRRLKPILNSHSSWFRFMSKGQQGFRLNRRNEDRASFGPGFYSKHYRAFSVADCWDARVCPLKHWPLWLGTGPLSSSIMAF